MNARLKEIRDALLEARSSTDYNIGSPAALDHLLVHVVAALEELGGLPGPVVEDMPEPIGTVQEQAFRALTEKPE